MTAPTLTRCGSDAGYARHLRRREVPCPECCVAHAAAERRRRDARLAAKGVRS